MVGLRVTNAMSIRKICSWKTFLKEIFDFVVVTNRYGLFSKGNLFIMKVRETTKRD